MYRTKYSHIVNGEHVLSDAFNLTHFIYLPPRNLPSLPSISIRSAISQEFLILLNVYSQYTQKVSSRVCITAPLRGEIPNLENEISPIKFKSSVFPDKYFWIYDYIIAPERNILDNEKALLHC